MSQPKTHELFNMTELEFAAHCYALANNNVERIDAEIIQWENEITRLQKERVTASCKADGLKNDMIKIAQKLPTK